MRPRPKKLLNSPRFAVDINTGFDELKKQFGLCARFISVANLTKRQNAPDNEIIQLCNKLNYRIITQNTKDFKNAPKEFLDLKIGIVCVNLIEDNFIDKIGQLLREHKKHENFYNRLFIIGNTTHVTNYNDLRNSFS